MIKTQVHRDGHAAHASDLKVENRDVGSAFGNGWGNKATIRDDLNGGGWRSENSLDFIEHPLGVCGDQNMHV
jgi:hypothetical protein